MDERDLVEPLDLGKMVKLLEYAEPLDPRRRPDVRDAMDLATRARARRGIPARASALLAARWARLPAAERPEKHAAQARRRWTCRSVLLRSVLVVRRWGRWTRSRGGGIDDAQSTRVVGRGGASEASEASGPGEVVEFRHAWDRGAPLHHPNRARRAALRLTTIRMTRAPASRNTRRGALARR